MTVESPILPSAPKAILRSRGLGWTLTAILVIALASGPIIWIAFMILWGLTESSGVDSLNIALAGLGFSVIAAIFGLPISLPAAILNAVTQSQLVRRGHTAWVWAPLAGMIGGVAAGLPVGFILQYVSSDSRFLTKFVADELSVALFLLVSAAMGALHRRLAFRREGLKIDSDAF